MRLSRDPALSRLGARHLSSSEQRGPLDLYKQKVNKGLIKQDEHQIVALRHLQNLYEELGGGGGASVASHAQRRVQDVRSSGGGQGSGESDSLWSNLFSTSSSSPKSSTSTVKRSVGTLMGMGSNTKGVYLWGGPGCGKTFMMDMFYETLDIDRKQRVHFNDFMIKVHKRLHVLKQAKSATDEAHLVSTLADELMRESYVLCFDEFQVTDIADAMILKSLLTEMLHRGCVIVATSNRPPIDLYKNGLQRNLFVPFIHLLEESSTVVSMEASSTDYRKVVSQDSWHGMYMAPATLTEKALFDQQFNKRALLTKERRDSRNITTSGTRTGGPDVGSLPVVSFDLMVYGHKMHIPHAITGRRIAKFHFSDLCEEMLGAADFIDLGNAFRVVYIEGVPIFNLSSLNEMRRLITLIDALYESGTLVYVLADAEPLDLLELTEDERSRSTKDEIFAFDRTISRLLEMQSSSYVEAWRAAYYPSEGFAGLIMKYPKLESIAMEEGTGGNTSSSLSMLARLSDNELKQIYAEYNWGRLPSSTDGSYDDYILGEALEVLAGDIEEMCYESKSMKNGGATVGRKVGTVRGKKYSFEEFVHLVRG